jgi:uncharacterized delta-60 repeat protein
MRGKLLSATLFSLLSLVLRALAFAGGDLAPSFGSGGEVTTPVGAGDSEILDALLQSDGRIVVGGSARDGSSSFAFARYLPSGALDPSFGDSGTVLVPYAGGDAEVNAIALQGDDIVAAGDVTTATGEVFALIRLLANGEVDATFGSNGIVLTDFGSDGQAWAVLVQPDQKIVAVGDACSGGNCGIALARYLPDGMLDPDFGMGGKVLAFTDTPGGPEQASAQAAALDGAGRILAAGFVSALGQFALARFNSDGGVDTTFGANGLWRGRFTDLSSNDIIYGIRRQRDGSFLVGGETEISFRSNQAVQMRLTPDADFDVNFGIVLTSFGQRGGLDSGWLQSDGKVVAAGTSCASSGLDQCAFGVVRFTPSGSADSNWGSQGEVTTVVGGTTSLASSSVMQPDDRIVVAGRAALAGHNVFALARYLPGDICGNGVIEPGEECDDGNLVDGDCCSSLCQIEPAGKVCRAPSSACDLAETCDGTTPTCPADTGTPDTDGDGVCDAQDACIDPSGGELLSGSSLIVDRAGGSRDSLAVRASFPLAQSQIGALDLISTGARVVLEGSSGPVLSDVVLPGGTFAGRGTRGWKRAASGTVWNYRDATASPLNGVSAVKISARSGPSASSVVHLVVRAKRGAYPVTAGDAPLVLKITLGDQAAAIAGTCGEIRFTAGDCAFNPQQTRLACRS